MLAGAYEICKQLVSKALDNCMIVYNCLLVPIRHPRKVLQRSPAPLKRFKSRAIVETANVEKVSS